MPLRSSWAWELETKPRLLLLASASYFIRRLSVESATSEEVRSMALLSVGDKAPAFSTKDQDGKTVRLSDFKGQRVVLYFYPKDDTPGCTKEACSFRDAWSQLKRRKVAVLGVSVDDEKSHRKFADKF